MDVRRRVDFLFLERVRVVEAAGSVKGSESVVSVVSSSAIV